MLTITAGNTRRLFYFYGNSKMPDRIKSILLVAMQFIFIFLLLNRSRLDRLQLIPSIFILLSAILVFWAIATMQKSKLRILPQPSASATLITDGPYHFIRHPMYTSVLLGTTGLLINHFNWMRLGFFIALAAVLIIKLTWEEKMLLQKFGPYKNYMANTSKLFPFIF